jgi:hypothetical protein
MEINGMAHVILTASNFERSRDFYRELLPFLGVTAVIAPTLTIIASAAAPRGRSALRK